MSEVQTPTTQQMMDNQKIKGAQKEVRFFSHVKCRHVASLLGEDLWYSSKNFVMARERERMLRNYARKTEMTEGNLNAQGILTRAEFERKRIKTFQAKAAVLEEQETQEYEFLALHCENRDEKPSFELDSEKILTAYYPFSQAALAQAQYRAMTHEMHIQAILSDPTEKLLSAMPMKRLSNPTEKIISSIPMRRSRQEIDGTTSSTRRSSKLGKSRISLVRPGKRFPRPTAVFRTEASLLTVGCSTPAA